MRSRAFQIAAFIALLAAPVALVWILDGDPPTSRWTNQATADQLALRLDAASDPIPSDDPVRVRVTLANHSERAAVLATPTIVPVILSFRVKPTTGTALPYAGRYFHLAPLNRSSIVHLRPGAKLSHTFDLADFFAFGAGRYRVRASYHNVHSGTAAKAALLVTEKLRSNTIEVHVE